MMIIGNEATGLWKKAFALAQAEELIKIVEGVADDKVKAQSEALTYRRQTRFARSRQRIKK